MRTLEPHLGVRILTWVDNSGSMNTSGGGRIDSMIDVTKRIAEIASYLIPEGEGMHIRFLNTSGKERELYDRYGKVKTASDVAEMVAQAQYAGKTKLGTILKEVVLEPHVYQHLNQNQKLERPLLISIITDGCVIIYFSSYQFLSTTLSFVNTFFA